MMKKERVAYWLKAAEQDRRVARHLVEKKDYSYALFFGHLSLEKTLKAHWAATRKDTLQFTEKYLKGIVGFSTWLRKLIAS